MPHVYIAKREEKQRRGENSIMLPSL